MIPLLGPTTVHYLLRGERNLSLAKAKRVAKATNSEILVWMDPARVLERREAWSKAFPKVPKIRKNAKKPKEVK
jgi:cytochrome P450